MVEDEDWKPGEEVQVARRELKGARAWLAAQEVSPFEAPRTEAQEDWSCLTTPRWMQGPRTGAEALRLAQEIMDEVQRGRGKTDTLGAAMATEPKVEVELPQAAGRKRVPKVAHRDLVEHELVGGSWEGIGAMRKGGEIRIGVSSPFYVAQLEY